MNAPATKPARSLSSLATPETLVLVGLLVALIVVAAITTDSFMTVENGRAVIRAAAITGIVAVGLTFVTLSGNFFSLSIGQTAALSGVVFAMMMRDGWPPLVAILITLLMAVAIGAAQGGGVSLGANPIIVTLGAGAALAGITGILTDGKGIVIGESSISWLGDARPLGLAIPTYAFIIVAILAGIFLARHRAGRSLMLMGSNRATAEASGLSFSRTTMLAFALSSVCCAIVAILVVLQFDRADGGQFDSLTFDALAAVLVGGAAIQGGQGSPVGTAIGAVFIATLANFMVLQGFSFGVQLTVQGVVVVLAVTIFHVLQQRRGAA